MDNSEIGRTLRKIMTPEKLEATSEQVLRGEIAAKKGGVHRRQNFLFPYYREEDIELDHGWNPDRTIEPLGDTEPRPPLSVVVVAFNCRGHTQLCVESLLRERSYPYLIYVVDNGSKDGTSEMIRRDFEKEGVLTLIRSEENLGFPGGINLALAKIPDHSDVVILNNDILVTPNWADGLIRAAHAQPDIGVVGCRLRGINGKIHHAGSIMKRDFIGETNLWGREMPDTNLYAGRWEPKIVMFSCAYLPARAVQVLRDKETGKVIDEEYFAYFEDSDTCMRLRAEGLKVVYDGSVELIHNHGTTTRENKMDFQDIFETSRKRFVKKWKGVETERLSQDPVVVRGFWHGAGGYCRITREFVRALDMADIPLWLNEPLINAYGVWTHEPVEENAAETTSHLEAMSVLDPSIGSVIVNLSVPHKWVRIPRSFGSGKMNVGFTMLEVDGIPDEWVALCNAMDGIFVPTPFNEETFQRSGVARPMFSVPAPVNTLLFHPNVRPIKTTGDAFRIFSCFEWGERKAPEMLLEAVGKVAQDMRKLGVEVELVLRSGSRVFEYTDEIADASRKYDFKIQTLTRSFPELLMPSLYRAADLFVLPTKGEGFGMPIAEAMACGVPVVTVPGSSVGTFFDEEVGYPVKWEWGPAKAMCSFYNHFNWAEPDPDHLFHQIKTAVEDVREDSGTLRAKVTKARRRVVDKFSYPSVARQFIHAIQNLYKFHGKEPPAWAR